MRGREKFAKYKSLIDIITYFYDLFPRKTREKLLVKNRYKAGILAFAKRYALLKTLAKKVGNNVAIYTDVYLLNVHELEIGNNVSFQPMTYIEAYGGVKIGNDVSFAEGSSVFSVNHGFEDMNIPIKDQPLKPLPIEIKDNVWIGSKATILGGVTIASGTIVAAGAVVVKSTEENSIVAGIPAIKIKNR